MGPAPTMMALAGGRSRSKRVSLVNAVMSLSPAMAGVDGREPVHTTMNRVAKVVVPSSPSTVTSRGPVTVASPVRYSAPQPVTVAALSSASAMSVLTSRRRLHTAAVSTVTWAGNTPN